MPSIQVTPVAAAVPFDNSTNGWSATQTQAAVEEARTKVSSNDTTGGFLNGKLVAGSGITFTENNNGGNETLTVSSAASPDSADIIIAGEVFC